MVCHRTVTFITSKIWCCWGHEWPQRYDVIGCRCAVTFPSCVFISFPWSWGTRCGLPSGRLAFALTHWAVWILFPSTATSTSCRFHTPKALPLLAGRSASALAARTPCLAWIPTRVQTHMHPSNRILRCPSYAYIINWVSQCFIHIGMKLNLLITSSMFSLTHYPLWPFKFHQRRLRDVRHTLP